MKEKANTLKAVKNTRYLIYVRGTRYSKNFSMNIAKRISIKIKKGITDLKEFEETISKLEILNTDSERENIRHFIELKKILGDEKFEQLTQRMKKKIAMQTHRMNKFYKCANQEKTKPNTK
jgi:hypothetical protein